ncbi:hypothetical protein HAX54_033313 [Datura stramonium]|uniref:Disease resistance protein winged helix domain-containing protein n=1 Tax=Datura stramonium TaxID=4076 RepID=A0ABS8SD75_DATST|nr:hypothetical protein [Datura stramonium]
MSLAYDVESIIDACEEGVPDWCLSLWIFHIIEDINLLMKEGEEMQEMKVSDLVLHNTIEAAREHTPHFARNPSRNEEMVGFKDVMVELSGKLIGGSSDLDVISIVGDRRDWERQLWQTSYILMSQLSLILISAPIAVSLKNIRERTCCLAILCDITDERAILERETESELAEDREIQVSKLAWLWIAEGFIGTHAEKLSEDLAKNYLENLIGRNLVMVAKKSPDGKIKTCRIHDLVLEFCRKKKAHQENFRKDKKVTEVRIILALQSAILHAACPFTLDVIILKSGVCPSHM